MTIHQIHDTDELVLPDARLLGYGSSRRDTHSHAGDLRDGPPGWKCSACRWLEARIFYDDDDESYIVHTVGRSVVTGEAPRVTETRTASEYAVVELLTLRRRDRTGLTVSLPAPAARALAEAAGVDARIREAYADRAVA